MRGNLDPAAGDAAEARPAGARRGRPHNLPAQPTPLVGRGREVEAVRARLRRADVRLVTLTGFGGVGKTRLAAHVAALVGADFAHGARLVSLETVLSPDLVAPTIAAALHVREAAGQPPLQRLAAALRDRQLLLVLDNFEQVQGAAPIVAELLAACPGLKLLVTSRTALHLRGEHELPVPPLALPDRARFDDLDAVAAAPAVALFVQRVQAVRPAFRLAPENARATAELCQRLDGLPLAIELAAARCKLLSPQALLKRLAERLDLLTGGAVDAPARQQTLRAAISWSYELLAPEPARLFRRLGVFAGGCALDAAAAVCGVDERATLDGLAALLDMSLVLNEELPDGEPRIRLLETIREHAHARLIAGAEAEEASERHAAHFLALARQAATLLTGPEQAEWLDRLELEHDNLRAALGWSLLRQPHAALALAVALSRFWLVRGYLAEGRAWLERALAAAPDAPAPLRLSGLHGAGSLAQSQGDYAAARAWHEHGLALARAEGDPAAAAAALTSLATARWHQGEPAAARALIAEALALLRGADDRPRLAQALNIAGNIAFFAGDLTTARRRYEESLALQRELRNRAGMALALHNLGHLAWSLDEPDEAEPLHRQTLAIHREVGDQHGAAASLNSLGWIAAARGDYAAAYDLYHESLALRERMDDRPASARQFDSLGELELLRGDRDAARLRFEQALTLRRALGGVRELAAALRRLADLDERQGAAALLRYDEALALAWQYADRAALVEALSAYGGYLTRAGALQQAEALLRHAAALAGALEDRRLSIGPLEALAALAAARGDPRRALRLLGAAVRLRRDAAETLPLPDRAQRAAALTALRGALPAAECASAWQAGLALSHAAALSEALAPELTLTAAPTPRRGPSSPLTPREAEIAALVARGLTNPQIAVELVISRRTADAHVANILGKLGLRSRTQLALWARDREQGIGNRE